MSPIRIVLAAAAALLLVACPTTEPAPVAAPTPEPTPAPPCCSVDELLAFHAKGIDDEAVIQRITEGRGPALPMLREAGVSAAVIDAWLEPLPEPEPEEAATPAPLPLTIEYNPGKGHYVLKNVSSRELTDLVITVNGNYVYRLPVPLRPGGKDTIQLHSHKSSASGDRFSPVVSPPGYKHGKLTKIYVRARQGTWSKRL
jgi:hypothetical protein